MDQKGDIRLTLNTADPYIHSHLSFQLLDDFNVSLRQTAEISDLNDDPKRFYPGVDLKLRLLDESTYKPEISVGLISAVGHKRMASEYLAFSKRFKSFDFSGGMAWGRLGSAGHVKNPLGIFGDHFKNDRIRRGFDDESPNTPDDWFTGDDIGFFAGVEYFTPIKNLSIKADWGADRYRLEKSLTDFRPPDPWSIGANYKAMPWADINIALLGGDKIMAGFSVHNTPKNWFGRNAKKYAAPKPLGKERTENTSATAIKNDSEQESFQLENIKMRNHAVQGDLIASPLTHMPMQLGRAARHMGNNAGLNVEEIKIRPTLYGLRGPEIRMLRRDLENAMAHNAGSPAEIWQNTHFAPSVRLNKPQAFLPEFVMRNHGYRLFIHQDLSLNEEDSGALFRTALVLDHKTELIEGLISGNAVRVNIGHNQDRLRQLRPASRNPVRSDVNDFSDRTLSLERSYLSYLRSLNDHTHIALTAGVLEEMYNGYGAEILYRPFGRTYALGAEAFQVFRRDPFTTLNLGLTGTSAYTAHLKGFYEIPWMEDTTLSGKVGRYLGEDIGGTVALSTRFQNGASLGAFLTATDQSDIDLFGSTTHLFSGLKLSMPIGNVKWIPEGSAINVNIAQVGRDTGQSLDKPIDLYETSEPLSYRHIANTWDNITN